MPTPNKRVRQVEAVRHRNDRLPTGERERLKAAAHRAKRK